MITKLNRRARQGSEGMETELEEGFTLIELLVVLLIIGILLAIAIPTFLSVTKAANNTAAQSNLQTALTGADTYYTQDNQSYTGIMTTGGTASSITQIDTGLTYSTTSSTADGNIFIDPITGNILVLGAYSPGTQRCWFIVDNKSGGTVTGVTNAPAKVGTYFGGVASSGSSCALTQAASVTAANWKQNTYPSV